MKTKLIMFEGIPGSGKSTIARKTALILNKNKISNNLYREGCLHPANLDGYVVMSPEELETLIQRFPQHTERLRSHHICVDGFILVQRQKDYRADSRIFRFLEQYAIWDSGLDFNLFVKLHRKRWSEFAKNAAIRDETSIFECAFLQDHITELMLFYEKSESEIIEYFRALEETILPLNPFLVYLQQNCVEETIDRISRQRIHEPDGRPWAERVAEMVSESPYGKENGLIGYAGMVEFFKRRKDMDLKVLDSLKSRHIFIDNDDYDWREMQGRVFSVIEDLIHTP